MAGRIMHKTDGHPSRWLIAKSNCGLSGNVVAMAYDETEAYGIAALDQVGAFLRSTVWVLALHRERPGKVTPSDLAKLEGVGRKLILQMEGLNQGETEEAQEARVVRTPRLGWRAETAVRPVSVPRASLGTFARSMWVRLTEICNGWYWVSTKERAALEWFDRTHPIKKEEQSCPSSD